MPEPVLVVAAAIVRGDPPRRVLAGQRSRPASLAGYWELPGGKVEPGETDEQALTRECDEELGVRIATTGRLAPDLTIGPDLVLRVYVARLVGADVPEAREHAQLRWLAADDVAVLPWLPSDRPLVPALQRLLSKVDG